MRRTKSPWKISQRIAPPPHPSFFPLYAKHLEKSKVYIATEVSVGDIYRPIVITNRVNFGLTKANERARARAIYRGNLISAERSLENNRRCFRFTIEAIGLNTLLRVMLAVKEDEVK